MKPYRALHIWKIADDKIFINAISYSFGAGLLNYVLMDFKYLLWLKIFFSEFSLASPLCAGVFHGLKISH